MTYELCPEELAIFQIEQEIDELQRAKSAVEDFEKSPKSFVDESRLFSIVSMELVEMAGGKKNFIRRAGKIIKDKLRELIERIQQMFSRLFGKARTKKRIDKSIQLEKKAERVTEELDKKSVPSNEGRDWELTIASVALSKDGRNYIHPMEVNKKAGELVSLSRKMLNTAANLMTNHSPDMIDTMAEFANQGGLEVISKTADKLICRPWADGSIEIVGTYEDKERGKMKFERKKSDTHRGKRTLKNLSIDDVKKFAGEYRRMLKEISSRMDHAVIQNSMNGDDYIDQGFEAIRNGTRLATEIIRTADALMATTIVVCNVVMEQAGEKYD